MVAAGGAWVRAGRAGARVAGLLPLALATLAMARVPAVAWTVEEHRLLADSAIARTVSGWPAQDAGALRAAAGPQPGSGSRSFLDTLAFGDLCAWAGRGDGAMARRHERGRTVLEQLRSLSATRLDSLTRLAARGDARLFARDGRSAAGQRRRLERANPVACFLQHHLTALALAAPAPGEDGARAPAPDPRLRRALTYEAIAQSYLADAFAAGHLMTPAGARPTGLDRRNLRHAHDDYANLGAYVLNARGETWQTFGDRLLLWYGPSFAHVLEASVTSLRELMLVYYGARGTPLPSPLAEWADSIAAAQGTRREALAAAWMARRDGPDHLAIGRLPTLMLIPMPVVATWSVRTEARDEHGLRRRLQFPQLAEPGGHDPTLDARDVARLPARAAVPGWMIPDALFHSDPMALVREHPDFASVRFAQAAEPPPSYAGALVIAGLTRAGRADGGGVDHQLGLGYGLLGESPLVVDRVSADLLVFTPERGGRSRALAFMLGASPSLPHFGIWRHWSLRWLDRLRFEIGHAWTRGSDPGADGPRYAVGIESPTVPLGFVYAGLTVRLRQQWTRLDRPRRGLGVELVLQ